MITARQTSTNERARNYIRCGGHEASSVASGELDELLQGERYDADSLSQAVRSLVKGHKMAAYFEGAASARECEEASRRLDAYEGKQYYHGEEERIGRVGDSAYETQFSEAQRRSYFARAKQNIEAPREIFGGFHPLDRLRLMLDEGWGSGARIMRFENGLANFGLIRFFNDGAGTPPHTDEVGRDMPWSLLAQQIDKQIALNIYFQVPEEGGELDLWKLRLSSLEYDAMRVENGSAAGLDESRLADPTLTIAPKTGSLLLFDARYPHRVRKSQGRLSRYSLSGFIGVTRSGEAFFFS